MPAPKTVMREKVVSELPLISAPPGQHKWWIKGNGSLPGAHGEWGLAVHGGPRLEVGN